MQRMVSPMKIYRIEFERSAQKFLDKQDRQQRLRLYKAIYKLPEGNDIKRLKGSTLFRLRVGDYRIIYSRHDDVYVIRIIGIDNRGQIYKRL